MKLLAAVSDKYVVFSVSRHDCRFAPDGTMMDGGQPNLQHSSGYNRSNRQLAWIELPGVSFSELFNDYLDNVSRKYGVHELSEVRFLERDEIPNDNNEDWKLENAIWGTHGKTGKEKLHYINLIDADEEHLKSILELTLSDVTKRFCEKILARRQKS